MEWLYTEFHRLMLSTAWKFSKSQADVEDIVSDSCVSLIRKINELRGMERNVLRSYIVSTVRNTAIALCRKQKLKNARFQQGDNEAMEQVAEQYMAYKQAVLKRANIRVRNISDAEDIMSGCWISLLCHT